jgi:hypothetical protein
MVLACLQLRPEQKKASSSSSSKRAQSARRGRDSKDKSKSKQEHDAAFVNEFDEYVVMSKSHLCCAAIVPLCVCKLVVNGYVAL